jgi:hypothetical protein
MMMTLTGKNTIRMYSKMKAELQLGREDRLEEES